MQKKISPTLVLFQMLFLLFFSACDDNDPSGTDASEVSRDGGDINLPPDYSTLSCEERPAFAGDSFARLLTRVQYNHVIEDLFGDQTNPASTFPPENQVTGFKNGIEHQSNALLVELYMQKSEEVSERYLDSVANLPECFSKEVKNYDSAEKDCQRNYINGHLYKIFRHSVNSDEQKVFFDLFDQFTTTGDSSFAAFTYTLQAMLQSPQFLYRFEFGSNVTIEGTESIPLTDFEIASRLSFFLWNSVPDLELLNAASDGQLKTSAQIKAQTLRMLNDPKFERTLRDFHEQWLHLDALSTAEKDKNIYPKYEEQMKESWSESIQQFLIKEIYDQNGNLQNMLESEAIYLDDVLGSLYNIDLSGQHGFSRHQWSEQKRAGLLTQPGLMALLANPGQSSPIQRGIFLREKFLCEGIQAPPPDLMTVPPDPDPNATTRERFAQHTEDVACSGCHVLIDPIGFGFENYDGIGQFRSKENGIDIDATGELQYTQSGNQEMEGEFLGVAELSKRLQKGDQVYNCIATQWFRYAMGRQEEQKDRCNLAPVQQDFYQKGGNFKEMIQAITLMPAFATRSAYIVEEQ